MGFALENLSTLTTVEKANEIWRMKFACRTPPPDIRYKRKPACSIHLPFVLQSHRLMSEAKRSSSTKATTKTAGSTTCPSGSSLLQRPSPGCLGGSSGLTLYSAACPAVLLGAVPSSRRGMNTSAVLGVWASSTPKQRSSTHLAPDCHTEVAVFLREPANISSANRAVTSMAKAEISDPVSGVCDLGSSADVNPPAKRSRACRTPTRSFDHSPTGRGTPPGPLRTRLRPRCTPRLYPGIGLRREGPLLVSTFQEAALTRRHRGKQHLADRHGTISDRSPNRKVDRENRKFQSEWTEKYLFTVPTTALKRGTDRPVCLLCNESVAVAKEYNVKRHFTTKHSSFSAQYQEGSVERQRRIDRLVTSFEQSQRAIGEFCTEQERAFIASLRVAWILTRKKRPFTESETIKDCMLAVVDEMIVDQKMKDHLTENFSDRFQGFSLPMEVIQFTRDPFSINHDSNFIAKVKEFIPNIDKSALQLEMIDLQSSLALKLHLHSEGPINFWCNHISQAKYPTMKKVSVLILTMFGSIYTCESSFSHMNAIKTNARCSLSNEKLSQCLRIALNTYEPDYVKMAKENRCHFSH
ncbi:hypothetical protein E1301_Tti022208 [Triplophysa tibetana]|uniref:Uncharacterized protein n=1 Tax=Triplophysa tibetana TaxID=1572043 RepID=A0A5A9PQJ2_9TELE|nr:hypothetical protein E1301_Tti022208 [Triplophysa tibetana]